MSKIAEECEDYKQALDLLLKELVDADLAYGVEFTETEQTAIDNAKAVFAKWEEYNDEGIETDENARS